jgi:hypothetical protein
LEHSRHRKLAHDAHFGGEEHHINHCRDGNDTVDDGRPKQCPDRVEPYQIKRDADCRSKNQGCSLIGVSKSSILKTDALAGVTVLYGVGLGRPIMGVRGEALQRVKRPFHGQQPARSRFNLPSRPGQRLRECGAGTMN